MREYKINYMKNNSNTIFARANSEVRAGQYKSAVDLYEEAMREAGPVLKNQISFNKALAFRRISEIHRAQSLGQFLIKDINQLVKEPTSAQSWRSTGGDPYFVLESDVLNGNELGWYQLSVNIQAEKIVEFVKVYFDYGLGFTEEDSIILSCKSGVAANRLIFIKRKVSFVRFDPIEREGFITINDFRITALCEADARKKMLQSLMTAVDAYFGFSIEKIWEIIKEISSEENLNALDVLFDQYDFIFENRDQNSYYIKWIEEVEIPGLPTAQEVRATLDTMDNPPLISIVMPVYNTDEIFLRECIESVLAQSYPYWELCIADDKSTKPHVEQVLKEYESRDRRIKVVYREQNGHISLASNSALKIATGDYVALLDHDDTLPEYAIYFMVLAIKQHPQAQILYSDEDKIDTKGRRSMPHFKSDWNPDLFFSQNYVSHLGVYKRDLLNRIKGFRVGLEGSQDQDLLLRCLPHVQHEQIIHLPRVLYHWRTVEGSTALASDEKSYTTEAGIRALRDYFSEHGPEGVRVEAGLVPNTYRTIWPLPQPAPLVSLLIPTRDKKDITEIAVCSILEKTTYPHYEIIILDNGSVEQETLDWFTVIQKKDARVRVIRYDHPFNYSAINNFGVAHSKGSVIGLVNNDVEVINSEWLTEMVSNACRSEIGCVGAKLYYSDDTVQHGGVIIGIGGVAGHSHKYYARSHKGYLCRLVITQNLSAVTAACLIIRREIYDAVGGLEEEGLKVAFNDVDFCLKVREAGYRNLWTPYAELYHHESISRGFEDTPEKQTRFKMEVEFMKNKWCDILKQDPYYNPNLAKDREDFSIGFDVQ